MNRCLKTVLLGLVVVVARDVAHGAEDFTGQKLVKHDFKGRDLAGARFDGADLTSAVFSGAKLTGASFVDANLTQTNFDGADCTGADFTEAKFDTTMARGTNLAKANLEGADLGGYSVFRGSDFRGANLRNLRGMTEVTECDFSGADLRGAMLKNAQDWKSPSARFTKATYDDATRFPKGVDPVAAGAVKSTEAAPAGPGTPAGGLGNAGGLLGGAGAAPTGKPADPAAAKPVGTGKDASGQDWRGRDLMGEPFDDINLSNATLIRTLFQDASLRRADLRGADLTSARLDGADLSGADLRGATLRDAHFEGTNLSGANLEGQDLSVLWGLSNTNFKGANLRGLKGGLHVTVTKCDFRRADLRGAHLAGPGFDYVKTCDFRGARYDDRTRWPKGFDVDGAGAVKVAGPAAGDEDEGAPDRLLAPDRDPDAPSEAVVKKVFADSVRDLAGSLILRFGKGGEEGKVPPVSAAVKYSVEYTKLTYLASEQVAILTDEATTVKAYPVDIEALLTSEGRDGSERTDPIHWTVRFYKTDHGVWKCVQPEAKRPQVK